MAIRNTAAIAIPLGAAAFVEAAAVRLPVPYHNQLQDNWCWAACCQMLLGFFGRADVPQCRMASAQFSLDCCVARCPDDCDVGCFPHDAYGRYAIEVGDLVDRTDRADLDGELDAGRPIEVYFVRSDNESAHVALVVGRNGNGTYEVHDPYYGTGPRTFDRIRHFYGRGRWDASYLGIAEAA